MADLNLLTDLLTVAVEGRPCKVEQVGGQLVAVIYTDTHSHNVQVGVQELDLTDPERLLLWQEQTLPPVIHNLDSVAFPHRHSRSMEATKRVVRVVRAMLSVA